jgi:hypothetical protein
LPDPTFSDEPTTVFQTVAFVKTTETFCDLPAPLRFSSVSQHLLCSDERQAQPEPVMAPAGPPEADSPVASGYVTR